MNDSGLRFDESVPVATIEERDPAEEAIPESERVAVQRQVVAELADQQAHVRRRPLQNVRRHPCRDDLARVPALRHRTHRLAQRPPSYEVLTYV